MMKITLQNFKYVATAISNITGVAIRELVYVADPEDNLVITYPENVDISAVEAEIPNVKATMALMELRIKRNQLLQETDWRDLPSYPGTDQAEWRTYRQALRDLTNTETPALNDNGELINVNWPVPPGESNGS